MNLNQYLFQQLTPHSKFIYERFIRMLGQDGCPDRRYRIKYTTINHLFRLFLIENYTFSSEELTSMCRMGDTICTFENECYFGNFGKDNYLYG